MKIIAISDIHSKFTFLERLFKIEKADILAVCGDVTDFSKDDVKRFAKILEEFDGISLIVHGNCDSKSEFLEIHGKKAHYIHGKSIEIYEIKFHGLGGSTYTPFHTVAEYSEDYYRKLLKSFDYGEKNVLISHCPPYGILDLTKTGVRAGSRAVRERMDKFSAILCGHVHEGRGIENYGNTIIINPGPLSRGYYAVANLESGKVRLLKIV